MRDFFIKRKKLLISIIIISVIELCMVLGYFINIIKINIPILLCLIVIPVILMGFLFITAASYYIKSKKEFNN
jgi:hypothetical protein